MASDTTSEDPAPMTDESVDDPAARTSMDIPDHPTQEWPALRPIGAERRLKDYVRDLWERREFAFTLPLGELRAQNQNTVIGQFWHLLNPLMLVLVYWLVFDVFLQRGEAVGGDRSSLFGGENYVGFLVAGIIPYTYTAKAMQSGARMIVANRKLVQTINFPRAVLPLSALLTETIAMGPALLVMFVLLLATGEVLAWSWLLVIPAFLLQTVFNAGLAFYTSRMTFHFQDVQQLLPYLLRLAFYVSGIIFAIDQVPEPFKTILLLNPLNAFVNLYREATLETPGGGPLSWEIAAAWTVVIAISGFLYFRNAESEYGRV